MRYSGASALVAFALIVTPAVAHSWIEQMMVISSNGTFTGEPGYCRNNTKRETPGFSDLLLVHILPGQGQPSIEERAVAENDTQGVLQTDPMCKKTQQTQYQSNTSPRLQAAPGDMVALRYEENGHVTLPNNQPGKPANRGNVYIYGTTQPKEDEIFLDIYGVWTADGTGGDKRGKLLATQPFDDGQCYQTNTGNISAFRQKAYPHVANTLMGANLWCQNDIAIPTDAPTGKPYTLYWVWDWPTAAGVDPNLPNGKAEIYTTCMDVDITGTKASRDLEDRQASPAPSGDLNNMAIPKYVKELAANPAPAAQASAPAASAAQPAAPVASSPAAQAAQPAAPVASSSVASAPAAQAAQPAAPVASSPAASAPAAQAAAPATVTVTVTAPAAAVQAPATQAATQPYSPSSALAVAAVAASAPTQAAAQAYSQTPAVSMAAAVQPSSQAASQSMPPTSLKIAPPVLSAASGNSLPTFTGTATAVTPSTMLTYASAAKNTSAPAVAPRGCTVNKCKVQKRSKILGAAAP